MAAPAWYTGSGTTSHIRHILARALMQAQGMGLLVRPYGSSPFTLTNSGASRLGVAYRRAGDRASEGTNEQVHLVDIAALDKATRRIRLPGIRTVNGQSKWTVGSPSECVSTRWLHGAKNARAAGKRKRP